MTNITFYSINESFETVEHGPVTKEQALQIVDKYAAMQVGLEGSAEDVVSKSLFGFSLDEQRFIEIAVETESQFRVKLEMPESRRILFLPMTSIYQKEITISRLEHLRDITTHFFDLPLEGFKRYFEKYQ